jgi:hypothetical protein
VPTVFNGAIGADLHIAFPIAARASHGYWFSYFAVISRGILAMFWFGVHTGYGGTCVSSVSHCMITLSLTLINFTRDDYCHLAQLRTSPQSSACLCWPHFCWHDLILRVLGYPIPHAPHTHT